MDMEAPQVRRLAIPIHLQDNEIFWYLEHITAIHETLSLIRGQILMINKSAFILINKQSILLMYYLYTCFSQFGKTKAKEVFRTIVQIIKLA